MTQASSPETKPTAIDLIESDIRAGKLNEAAVALNTLVVATPSDPRIYLSLAMLARAAKKPTEELLSLRRAVTIAPQWPPAYVELAKLLSRNGQHEQAVAMADKAVELAPRQLSLREVAVAVANAAGNPVDAQRHLEAALALKPGDAAIQKALGICLEKQQRYDEAEAHWRAALAKDPNDVPVLGWLGILLIRGNRHEEARGLLQLGLTLSPNDPSLKFFFAVACGETPRTQPMAMVQPLFDVYANRFDTHLVGKLNYTTPVRIAQMIRQRHADLNIDVLDLGCGTGLLGEHLGRVAGRFVGVDLSIRMLEYAVKRNVYSKLKCADLLAELRQTAPNAFDCITACDVFVYVGDLSEVIPAAFKALRVGGVLIFSCESADDSEGELVLRSSLRYAHSRGAVERLCREAGFSSCGIEPLDLRLDKGVPVAGFIAVASKR